MADSCFLYYITDRTAFSGDESSRRRRLLEKIGEAARAGVDYIQLREKDLRTRDLESLAQEAVSAIRKAQLATGKRQPATALLINSRTDVALGVQADGVHLRSDDISPREVRTIWSNSINPSERGRLARRTRNHDLRCPGLAVVGFLHGHRLGAGHLDHKSNTRRRLASGFAKIVVTFRAAAK